MKDLISIGVPIRNGAAALRLALGSLISQTYRSIEIIISDNNSQDATQSICQEYALLDSRIRYFRQSETLTAVQNFRFCYEQSRGKYFMFAAHDDIRSLNYLKVARTGFDKYPSASVVISDTVQFSDYSFYQAGETLALDFDMKGMPFGQRFTGRSQRLWVIFYGLIRAEVLKDYPWYAPEVGPDVPFDYWLVSFGDPQYVPGAAFYYYFTPKSNEKRSAANFNKQLGRFYAAENVWASVRAIRLAERLQGRRRGLLTLGRIASALYFDIHGGKKKWLKGRLYGLSPRFMRRAWHLLR